MYKHLVLGIVFCLFFTTGCEKNATLSSDSEKQSYSYVFFLGDDVVKKGMDLDTDSFISGIQDGLDDNQKLSDEDIQAALTALDQALREKYAAEMAQKSTENANKSNQFLQDNKSNPGVITLDSGLQYKVIQDGSGNTPSSEDTVVVHYKGTLIDGTEFDSSYSRNEPATFQVTQVIAGWTEALQLMQEGSKWELYIPADLAYGNRGAGGLIGPNEALIFEVELLSIK